MWVTFRRRSSPHTYHRRALMLAAMVVGLAGCGKSLGYSFRLRPGSPGTVLLTERQLFNRISRLADDAHANHAGDLKPLFHAASEPDMARRDRRFGSGPSGESLVTEAVCSRLRPVASFVHLSDVQIKEASVEMEPPITHIIGGADRHDSRELYGYGTFLSTVLAVNQLSSGTYGSYAPCPAPLPPQFAIHTGDAVDASMFSELFQFLAVVNELNIPFLNVIGNHDDLFFGTLPADRMSGFNVVAPFIPVHNYKRFMRGHHPDASRIDMSIPASPRVIHEATAFGTSSPTTTDFPLSDYHGFDWRCDTLPPLGLCPKAEGYYANTYHVRHPEEGTAPLEVRLIVLNTFEWPPGTVLRALIQRSLGRMHETQFTWLENQLNQPMEERSVTLVFGHHPFSHFADGHGERLQKMLSDNANVIGYFAGHTHKHEVRQHSRTGGIPLWEVIGGANISYPQFGVHVELLEDATDESNGYIRLRSFEEQLSLASVTCNPATPDAWLLPCISRAGRTGARLSAGADWQAQRDAAIREANGMLKVQLKR